MLESILISIFIGVPASVLANWIYDQLKATGAPSSPVIGSQAGPKPQQPLPQSRNSNATAAGIAVAVVVVFVITIGLPAALVAGPIAILAWRWWSRRAPNAIKS